MLLKHFFVRKIAHSILKQHGFDNVHNVAGGLTGYSAAGYIRECNVYVNPHGSRFFTDVRAVTRHWDTEQTTEAI